MRRSRPPIRRSFAERNRTRLIWLGVLAVALAFGGIVFLNVTAPAYACSIEWVAPPTSAPAPSASPLLGFPQEDMGRSHVPVGTVVKYLYCPPASGNHYAQIPQGPIPVRVYGPNEKAIPEGWVHNLEHGALVLLYNCSAPGNGSAGGDGCTDAAQAKMKALYTQWPASPICALPAGVVGPVMARFDNMAYPYAALVWDQVLPLQTLDEAQILAFFQQKDERFNPEQQCAPPSAAPGASESPGASTTPSQPPASSTPSTAPSGSPAPAAS